MPSLGREQAEIFGATSARAHPPPPPAAAPSPQVGSALRPTAYAVEREDGASCCSQQANANTPPSSQSEIVDSNCEIGRPQSTSSPADPEAKVENPKSTDRGSRGTLGAPLAKQVRGRQRREIATRELDRKRGRKQKDGTKPDDEWDRTLELMWPKSIKLLREHHLWPPP